MKLTVKVFSGSCMIEEKTFNPGQEKKATDFASFWQDDGYRVRIVEEVA